MYVCSIYPAFITCLGEAEGKSKLEPGEQLYLDTIKYLTILL